MAKLVPNLDQLTQQHNEKMDANRMEAYRNESDSLFFKAQRGEIPMQEWTDKVQEIKLRFPKL